MYAIKEKLVMYGGYNNYQLVTAHELDGSVHDTFNFRHDAKAFIERMENHPKSLRHNQAGYAYLIIDIDKPRNRKFYLENTDF